MSDIATILEDHAHKARLVVADVSRGATLAKACETHDLEPSAFSRACARLRDLATDYAHAQLVRADLLADEVVTLADGTNDPAKVRNQMQARQWRAAKLAPKIYGERLDIAVTQTISVADALTDARTRILRPMSDQQLVEDAQVVDSQALALPTPRDEASQQQDEPDIFS